MKFWMCLLAVLLSGCSDTSLVGQYHLTGHIHKNATLTLSDGNRFTLCWNGCVQGKFNVIDLEYDRSRIEFIGGGAGGKIKDILSTPSSDGFIPKNNNEIGYKDKDYIDFDLFYEFTKIRIYISSEPDVYFEKNYIFD